MTSSAPRTRSNSKTSTTAPTPEATAPTLATPASVATTGYPDKPVNKGKTPINAFHFSRKPVSNNYTGSSTTKEKPRTSSTASSARSSNSFGVLTALEETPAGNSDEFTIDEQVARELIGADKLDAVFEAEGAGQDSIGTAAPSSTASSPSSASPTSSEISEAGRVVIDKGKGRASSNEKATHTDVMKELARKLAGRPFQSIPAPTATPSTSSVPWSAAVVAATQRGSAAIISVDDSSPVTPQNGSSPFLSPIPTLGAAPAVFAPPAIPSSNATSVSAAPVPTPAPIPTQPAPVEQPGVQAPTISMTSPGSSTFAAVAAAPAPTSAPITRAQTQRAAAAMIGGSATLANAVPGNFQTPPTITVPAPPPINAPTAPAIAPAAPIIAPVAPTIVHATYAAAPAMVPAAAMVAGGLVAPAVMPAGAAPAAAQGGPMVAAPPPLMPVPAGGFPPVHGWNARNVFTNVSDRTNIAWTGLAGDKILIYEFDGSHPLVVPAPANFFERAKNAIARYFSCPPPLICPAEPIVDPTHLHEAPFIHVLNNLAQQNLQTLIDRHFWSFPDVSFFAMPFPPATSTFVCTLDGFLFMNTQPDAVAVATTVAIAIRDEPKAQTFLARTHDNYPAGVDAMTHFISTLRVTAQELSNPGGSTRVAWNVTAEPPTADIDQHNEWLAIINGMVFHTPMHYVGKPILPPLACNRCMSLGHPSGRCLLPSLPGFNGPQVASTAMAPNVTPAPAQAPVPVNNGPGGGRGRGGHAPRGRGGRGGGRGGRRRARGRGF
ncbi:hypothetical protein C8R43DRAFT_955049 [Mycena crocata]|nr:hypothetical protein C8R43DRAFT_955049 [Mycena crocata]